MSSIIINFNFNLIILSSYINNNDIDIKNFIDDMNNQLKRRLFNFYINISRLNKISKFFDRKKIIA